MREENSGLKSESETIRRQLKAQDEAIQGAHHLKEEVDEMINGYERLTKDQAHQVHKNREQAAELSANVNGRRVAEINLENVTKELDELRQGSVDQQANDSRAIN